MPSSPDKLCVAAAWLATTLIPTSALGQLDDTWTVTVGGQTVQVNRDGTFTIPNVAAPDLFGPTGPGSPPDFLSDDFLRVTGVSHANGVTRYVFSDFFQITQGESFNIGTLTITDLPPLANHSVTTAIADTILTRIGQQTQLTTTALLSDGTTLDVTPRAAWTIYRSSNASVADVDEDGLVTAVDRGTAFLTAVNEGAATVIGIIVSPGDPLTTLDGFVRRADGSSVAGAEVTIFDQFAQRAFGVTDVNGHYEVPNVVTEFGLLHVKAHALTDGVLSVGAIINLEPFPAGITDAGIVTLAEFGLDSDGDRLPDDVEVDMGLDPRDPDSDGDGIIDGFEDADDDGLANCEELALGTNLLLTDSDGDLLDDGDELEFGTDPIRVDTDKDGFIDGEEIEFGSNPVDRFDLPVDPSDTVGECVSFKMSLENRTTPASNVPAFETVITDVAVENLGSPSPNVSAQEIAMSDLSVENLSLPAPNIAGFETVMTDVSVENAAPPPIGIPTLEATGRQVSVENQ